MKKIILDLCSGSGNWSKPYSDAGYEVILVDEKNGEDVRLFERRGFIYGILAAPPCTVFAASGARWQRSKEEMIEGLSVVDACLRLIFVCKPKWWALENPIGNLTKYIGPPRLYFQPWEYGDPYTKKSCLWGDFKLPKKFPVRITEYDYIHEMPSNSDRAENRSITPLGFANAFFEANP